MASPGSRKQDRTSKNQFWRYVPIVVIAVAIGLIWISGATQYLSFEHLLASRDRLANFIDGNQAISLLLYAAIYIIVVALSVPGALALTIAGGFLFGGWVGGAVTVVAATIGACILFLAARTSFGETLARRCGPWMERLRGGFHEGEVSYMLFLRLVPVFPFWLVNLAPALLGVNFRTFAWTTFVGVMPGTFAYSLAAGSIDAIAGGKKKAFDACIAAGRDNCSLGISPQDLVNTHTILAFAAIGVAALIPVAVKKLRSRRTKTKSASETE